jgi:hypothetical protein
MTVNAGLTTPAADRADGLRVRLGLALPLLLATTAAGAAPRDHLPPYTEGIRCAGLAEAAFGASDQASRRGRQLYDAAIFWGLAASEAARKAGLLAERFTRDQQEAAAKGRSDLAGGAPQPAAELEACLKRVPPLGK